jgi:hypothetical protein
MVNLLIHYRIVIFLYVKCSFSLVLALSPPNNVEELRHFLGMVQYYWDMWARRSEMLALLTDLMGECGGTKTTKNNKTKK